MEFLAYIASIVLGSYLTFTNALATEITRILPPSFLSESERKILSIEDTQPQQGGFRILSSLYSNNEALPDILIKNAAYQKAAVVESIDPQTAPATALDALVNIYCTYKTDTYIKTTTGTGFFIDTDGIILTNAHVAQFLLLEGLQGDTNCVVRTGNPATPTYEVELLYISPAWVKENAKQLNDKAPKGTGERDYALLYVSSALDRKPMPAQFEALPFDIKAMNTNTYGTDVFATGYPAESLLAQGFDAPLVPKQATTTIGELMTFGSNLVDIFTIRGSIIGEHGSSGGPIVNLQGKAIGIISTRGDDEEFGSGSLRAITISYINRTIQEETGISLIQNLGGDLPFRAKIYRETIIPFLQQSLKDEL